MGAARGRVVPSGSVLITCIAGSRNRIGDAAVTDREVAINQQINAIVPNQDTDPDFLCALVSALKPKIREETRGVMTGIINKRSLEEITAIQPPLPLQEDFANHVRKIREIETGQAASRKGLEALSQSLLHRAFNGDL